MPSRLSDGLFIAVDVNGEVCCGTGRAGIKLYVHQSVAVKKAGLGGKVYRVDERGVTLVWPEAKTFFLNERHELPVEEMCKYCHSPTWSCQGTCLG